MLIPLLLAAHLALSCRTVSITPANPAHRVILFVVVVAQTAIIRNSPRPTGRRIATCQHGKHIMVTLHTGRHSLGPFGKRKGTAGYYGIYTNNHLGFIAVKDIKEVMLYRHTRLNPQAAL